TLWLTDRHGFDPTFLEFSVKSYKYFTPTGFSMKNIFVQNSRAILITNFGYENVGIGTSL
ncbi:hypothetical protein, partial [Enterobacter hormaechei]|uniref:hypothetical protein n=1 Tax=Enterobacter hormaechei TaxID=158836 RepID=UPI0023E457A2